MIGTIDQLWDEYPGQLRLVVKDFPLPHHARARLAAEATRAHKPKRLPRTSGVHAGPPDPLLLLLLPALELLLPPTLLLVSTTELLFTLEVPLLVLMTPPLLEPMTTPIWMGFIVCGERCAMLAAGRQSVNPRFYFLPKFRHV